MGKPMTKVQIVDALAEKLSVTKKLAAQFVDEYAKLAYAEAKNEFVLPGLGKLTVVKRNARQGRRSTSCDGRRHRLSLPPELQTHTWRQE